MRRPKTAEDEAIETVVVRLNAVAMGLVFGLLAGGCLMIATIWLVIKGGRLVGPHLALLREYLPGYSVTIGGSVVGLLYGLLLGFVSGYLIGAVYNRMVK